MEQVSWFNVIVSSLFFLGPVSENFYIVWAKSTRRYLAVDIYLSLQSLELVNHTNISCVTLVCLIFQKSWRWISRLEFLSVHHRPTLDWSNNLIHPPLLHLLYLSTLTPQWTISMTLLYWSSSSIFSLHSNLRHTECPSLTNMLPSMQTLKHIAMNIDVDPLFNIPSELDMRTKNIIKTVTSVTTGMFH